MYGKQIVDVIHYGWRKLESKADTDIYVNCKENFVVVYQNT